jgi:hypothetical protein
MRKAKWPAFLAAGVLALFMLPAVGHAEVKCPWLNAATAAGVLGGDVLMNVTKSADQVEGKGAGAASYPDQVRSDRFDASCTFTHRDNSGVAMLKIIVRTMADAAADYPLLLASCPGRAVPLAGIGNEAIYCAIGSSGHAGNSGQEQVIARVRDRSFVLTIHRVPKSDTATDAEVLSDETRNIAEQVAGSLF